MSIRVEGYSKLYDRQMAVEDLSFEVEGGEILGLCGPNGAGKTTTLAAIAGILVPTRGRLVVDGFDVREQPLEAKRRLAFIPDEPQLFDSLTVDEHLDLTARLYGVPDFRPRADVWIERLELGPQRDKMADQLSRGMRQKVAVACAMMREPSALLLDEPLTGLDPRGIRTLYAALRESAERGAAVILSSHLLGQIDPLCHRFLILREGHKIADGSKLAIREKLRGLREDASLEEIFFQATEGEGFASAAVDPPAGPDGTR